ncbi:MAG: formylglycine-generating enzyme family protein, partial [Bdellovibrionota bacterium]
VQLLQNFLDTPRFKDLVLKDKNSLPEFMVIARGNKKIREALSAAYEPARKAQLQPIFERVLSAADAPDDRALKLIRALKEKFGSNEARDLMEIQALIHGTSLESGLREELLAHALSGFQSEGSLGRALSFCQGSSDPIAREFGMRILSHASDPGLSRLKVIQAFQEIAELQKAHPELHSFYRAAERWMGSEAIPAQRKARFLLAQLGTADTEGHSTYEILRRAIPRDQLAEVQSKIDGSTNLSIFESLAADSGASSDNLKMLREKSRLESFEFVPNRYPEGGTTFKMGSPQDEVGRFRDQELHDVTLTKSFEIQATPVTQLQWALVMRNNPSKFVERRFGKEVQLLFEKAGSGPRHVTLDLNRPVENITWNQAQEFIDKLNALDPHYTYRLPTEAEWEYSARGGTTTAWSYGDNPEELDSYAWHKENSGGTTHDVASLKPNPFGLFDVHGNVSEYTQDWHDYKYHDFPPNLVDPTGPPSGVWRMTRGGTFMDPKVNVRSAVRSEHRPSDGEAYLGIRLVRTPK